MINLGISTVTSVISTAVSTVEKLDTEATKRPQVYAQQQATGTDLERLKVVTGDLIDLWLYEGSKGLEYLQASRAYKLTDPYMNYIQKYESIKDSSLVKKIPEVVHQIVLILDEATAKVGLLIQVLIERQGHLLEYIQKTYSNVVVLVQDNWLRLDFNHDGTVSIDDVRIGLNSLYEFLKNYDYIEATTRIKSQVYEEAKKYIQAQGVKTTDDISITEQEERKEPTQNEPLPQAQELKELQEVNCKVVDDVKEVVAEAVNNLLPVQEPAPELAEEQEEQELMNDESKSTSSKKKNKKSKK